MRASVIQPLTGVKPGVTALPRYGKIRAAMGLRLVVGQQTLDLYAEVRILQPQPEELASL